MLKRGWKSLMSRLSNSNDSASLLTMCQSKSWIASTKALNLRSHPMRRDGWKYWETRLRRSRAFPI